MPSINDIVTVAEALEKSPIAVLPDRCVAVRNRNASCRCCIAVCAKEAIRIYCNELLVDSKRCVGCGACTVVCPTEALVPCNPADDALKERLESSRAENGGNAVVACERIASKSTLDPSRYAVVSCLARVEESLLLDAVSHDAIELLLVDGNCATCKYRDCTSLVDDVVRQTSMLVHAHGGVATVRRTSEFPEGLAGSSDDDGTGSTRRGFFSDVVGAAKETAMTAAQTKIGAELGLGNGDVPIGERLRVGDNGTLPLIQVKRHETIINAMDAIGAPQVDEIDTSLFASVDIDVDRCNACGMCAMFCPTGALRRDTDNGAVTNIESLEFSACDCVQCGLCKDVCWKECLTLSSKVSTSELFDFEPRVFKLR